MSQQHVGGMFWPRHQDIPSKGSRGLGGVNLWVGVWRDEFFVYIWRNRSSIIANTSVTVRVCVHCVCVCVRAYTYLAVAHQAMTRSWYPVPRRTHLGHRPSPWIRQEQRVLDRASSSFLESCLLVAVLTGVEVFQSSSL